ncbi:MAG: 16S rRNA (guanine(966)-N(2))-methyltransferase RsmD [Alteromonadaceae bacterium]|nr:16S rRNA (guanine(966)-N(2))-methyltransferase RsmD [Alteromonadaceae bacterium]|tara:strand:+ start:46 stop:660 length:615 start_codon:yes stop_codon:yes gene_type:complete
MARPPSRPARAGKQHTARQESKLRLIAGVWRSRRLTFEEIPGLRPTPDRVRETLFNWLAPTIAGARCLDLFAGSGALGLEALSRGASEAFFVEYDASAARILRKNLELLGATTGQVWTGDALQYLAQPAARPFDIVFLDPPFRAGWLDRILPLLESGNWVAPGGYIYVEYEKETAPSTLPTTWISHRQKEAGQLRYQLFRRTAP